LAFFTPIATGIELDEEDVVVCAAAAAVDELLVELELLLLPQPAITAAITSPGTSNPR
jgi:hypothetical protein